MDFFRDKDTYQRRTWIRRKTPLKSTNAAPGPKSPVKTTTTKVKSVSVQPARDADGDDDGNEEDEDVEVNAMTVLAATRPLDFQRQGRSP